MTNRAANVLRKSGGKNQGHVFETMNRVFAGKKIDIDMVDANINDVFRLIAEVSNFNIIASDDIKGTITLRLKNVPWDQALDIILKSKGLDFTRVGNIICIAPAAKLRHPKEAALVAKKAQEKEILSHLYQFYYHILNPARVPMSLEQLRRAVGLSARRIKNICDILIEDELIERIVVIGFPDAVFYRITDKGRRHVKKTAQMAG